MKKAGIEHKTSGMTVHLTHHHATGTNVMPIISKQKLRKTKGLYSSAIVVRNKESLVPLALNEGSINYGFESIKTRIYKKDEVNVESWPPKTTEGELAVSGPGT